MVVHLCGVLVLSVVLGGLQAMVMLQRLQVVLKVLAAAAFLAASYFLGQAR